MALACLAIAAAPAAAQTEPYTVGLPVAAPATGQEIVPLYQNGQRKTATLSQVLVNSPMAAATRLLRAAGRVNTPITATLPTAPVWTEGAAYVASTLGGYSAGGMSGTYRFSVNDTRYIAPFGGPGFASDGQYHNALQVVTPTVGAAIRKSGHGGGIAFCSFASVFDVNAAMGAEPFMLYQIDPTTGSRLRAQTNDYVPTVFASNYNKFDFGTAALTGTVAGGTLTVSSVTSGTIAIGERVYNGTALVGQITGGSGTTWTIDNTAASASGSGGTAITLTAANRALRCFELSTGNGSHLFGVNVPAADTIWPYVPQDQPRIAGGPDSYWEGAIDDPVLPRNAIKLALADWVAWYHGVDQITSIAIGGTGIMATNATGTAATNVQQRLDLGDWDASRIGPFDLIYFPPSSNDNTAQVAGGAPTDAVFQAAYQTAVAALMVKQPTAIIVGFSPLAWNGTVAPQSRMDAAKAAFLAAANGDPRMIWLDGSTTAGNYLPSGLLPTLIGPGGIHLTKAGVPYLAQRITQDALQAIRARYATVSMLPSMKLLASNDNGEADRLAG